MAGPFGAFSCPVTENIGFGWKILKKIETRQPSMEKLDGNSDEVVY
jgi:hypothetical protein